MELIMPGLGVIFWMTLSFAIVLFILRKFAWKPILGAIKERENNISKSLKDAEKVEKEIASLNETKERIIEEANNEKIGIVEQGKKAKEELLKEAKEEAHEQKNRMIAEAKKAIEAERKNLADQIKKEITFLSVDMAEKILVEELSDKEKQKKFVMDNLENINLN